MKFAMVIEANYLFVFTLYLSSALLSLGYHELPRQKTDIDRCIDQCREVVEDVSSLFDCAARCDREYSPELEPEGDERELDRCQQRCQSEEGRSWKQQQECQSRCEEEEREREREREQEREARRERREREERKRQEEEREREREGREKQEREREREQQRKRRERQEREQQRKRREEEREKRERQREREREEGERDRERERDERQRDRERERQESSNNYSRDPEVEYEECLQTCRKQPARQQPPCKKRCKKQYEDLKGKQQQEEEDGDDQGGRNGGNHHEPHQPYEQCRKQCERQERGEQHQQQCKSWCEQQREKEESRRRGEQDPQRESRGEGQEQQRNNPYYFNAQSSFQYLLKSQEGHMKVLQRFRESSELLRGINHYRLAIAEANPSTLVVPHHSDAEIILVVVRGRGIITFVSNENRESFNVELGEVLRIPAGTTLYLINQDNNEKLQVAMLIHPVNIPGQFRGYFAAGAGNPESYYKVFSYDILERALNTPSEELDKLFEGQQRQHGAIRRLTPEQLRALTQHSSQKHRDKESRGPYNLLSRKPLYHNNFGRFFEASSKDYGQLQEIGVSVTYVEIKQGSMMVPHYNSKTTTVVVVVDGRGRLEMGCPHLARQSQGSEERGEEGEEEEENSGQLQKITTQLSPGDVFVIPAGHPIALVAQNENLRMVGFGINALNNQRNFLAGKINLMNQVERAAMEVAFNVPARLVERIFSNNPKESFFVAGSELAGPGEEQQKRGGRGTLCHQ